MRFVGEVMDALASGPRTHDQLLDLAREYFDLPWETSGPVRDRTTWLTVTGMVDLFDGRVHLTDAGRDALARIVMGRPEPDDTVTTAQLTPAVGAVAQLIEQLDEAGLRARADGANLYIPGTSANGGTMDALQVLVEAAMPSITEADFRQFVKDTFPKAQTTATARTAKDTLKALGLIRQTSSKTWSATPAAIFWVESGEPLDLARTVHASIAFFGEMLGVLDETACPASGMLAERSSRYLPNRDKPLSRSAVNTRLNLLEVCGLVTRLSQTAYRTTALGRAFKHSVPCLTVDDGSSHGASEGHPADALGSTLPQDSLGADIAAELESSALASATPERLEKAAVAALAYLGMPGEHVGGNQAVDGRVRFGVGADSRVLAVETKTAASGQVVDQTLFNLAGHRAQIGAEVTLLIGPGFRPSMLKEADDDPAIAVIETGLLAEVIRRQERTPLTPAQLAPLVDPALRAAQRGDAIRGHWRNQEVRGELEYALVDILNVEAEDPLEEGGWLDLTSVRRELRTLGYRVAGDEVMETLDFLASRRIGVLDRSDQGYRCIAGVHTAGQRIRALGHQWTAAAEIHHRMRAGGDTSQEPKG
ncbi:hypothetical protein B7P34_09850 [Streptosporangium nondiastaticum]|uniref:Restriction endonuclease type IV Mrr domain-containing protein n=1 Tax=Streptosporangium nondiastaticum TaxID=35764 RepID=A0A9X7JS72_9ACTN|nr:hypothetical protein B7P34_09850 [Streptosporangium nondiastaticum]